MKLFKKLDSRGVAHHFALAVIIVGLSIFGVYELLLSHADTVKLSDAQVASVTADCSGVGSTAAVKNATGVVTCKNQLETQMQQAITNKLTALDSPTLAANTKACTVAAAGKSNQAIKASISLCTTNAGQQELKAGTAAANQAKQPPHKYEGHIVLADCSNIEVEARDLGSTPSSPLGVTVTLTGGPYKNSSRLGPISANQANLKGHFSSYRTWATPDAIKHYAGSGFITVTLAVSDHGQPVKDFSSSQSVVTMKNACSKAVSKSTPAGTHQYEAHFIHATCSVIEVEAHDFGSAAPDYTKPQANPLAATVTFTGGKSGSLVSTPVNSLSGNNGLYNYATWPTPAILKNYDGTKPTTLKITLTKGLSSVDFTGNHSAHLPAHDCKTTSTTGGGGGTKSPTHTPPPGGVVVLPPPPVVVHPTSCYGQPMSVGNTKDVTPPCVSAVQTLLNLENSSANLGGVPSTGVFDANTKLALQIRAVWWDGHLPAGEQPLAPSGKLDNASWSAVCDTLPIASNDKGSIASAQVALKTALCPNGVITQKASSKTPKGGSTGGGGSHKTNKPQKPKDQPHKKGAGQRVKGLACHIPLLNRVCYTTRAVTKGDCWNNVFEETDKDPSGKDSKKKARCVYDLQHVIGANPTSKFDGRTTKHVKTFQGKNFLQQDGVVGPLTWGQICRVAKSSSIKKDIGCSHLEAPSGVSGGTTGGGGGSGGGNHSNPNQYAGVGLHVGSVYGIECAEDRTTASLTHLQLCSKVRTLKIITKSGVSCATDGHTATIDHLPLCSSVPACSYGYHALGSNCVKSVQQTLCAKVTNDGFTSQASSVWVNTDGTSPGGGCSAHRMSPYWCYYARATDHRIVQETSGHSIISAGAPTCAPPKSY